jgi:serine/threonine-protein kinase
LNHPGIAVLYEIGEVEDARSLATEYVEGRSLQEHLAVGPLSRHCLIDDTIQVEDALEHAHLRGILHRDIKPANIMVTVEKLLDFGLARLLERRDGNALRIDGSGDMDGHPTILCAGSTAWSRSRSSQ